jgi:hypothetical protein
LQANGAGAPWRVLLNKEAAYKATHLFSLKVFENPKNFFQKVFWRGLGQRPKTFSLASKWGRGPMESFAEQRSSV